MSGFLGHLIARSFGLAETIRPRAPSLFEPRPEERTFAPLLEIDASGAAEDADPTVDAARPRSASATASRAAATRAPLAPAGRADDERDALASSPIDEAAPLAPAAVPARVDPVEAPRYPQRDATRVGDSFRDAPAARNSANAVTRNSADASNAASAPQAAESFSHADAPVETESRDARNDAPPAVFLRLAPATRAQRPQASASSAPRFDRRMSTPATAPEPEPTIQVTIGRIEIRAEAGPSAPVKPRAAARTMSLDDYLLRRHRSGA